MGGEGGGGGGGGGGALAGTHVWRVATTFPGAHITEALHKTKALPREVLHRTSPRARRALSRIPKNASPAGLYRSERRYARSYGSIHQPGPSCPLRRPRST